MNQIPFPGKMFYDLGDSFLTGCSMGAVWYFLKGAYIGAPRSRIKSGITLLRQKATSLGGSFATWSLFYSASYCACSFLRKREDCYNGIIAGFSTGFILSMRSGLRSAIKSGIAGGFFLSAVEGISMIAQQYQRKIQIVEENKIIQMYKRQYEKQGIRFYTNLNLNDKYINENKEKHKI